MKKKVNHSCVLLSENHTLKFTPNGALTYTTLYLASFVAGIGAEGRGMWVNINWSGVFWPSF